MTTAPWAVAGFLGGLFLGATVAALVLWHVLGEITERLWDQQQELLDRMQSGSLAEFRAAGVERAPRERREVVRDRTGLMSRPRRDKEEAS